MTRALRLAEQARGYTSPNPMVGCVIVDKSGNLISEGYHVRAGEPHAEVVALQAVSDPSLLAGATLYVTLEPCSHQGKTPACAPVVAGSGVARVVIGMKDPTPKVNGQGIQILKEAGIEVETGVLEAECEQLNEYWLYAMATGLPFITLKIAQSADGYIANLDGESKWISCEESRKTVHRWRSEMDAVMVGRQTAAVDNPSLTVRLVEGRQPRRIVLDGPLSLPSSLNLLSDAHEEKTILVTWNREKAEKLHDPMLKMLQPDYFRGEVIIVDRTPEGHIDLHQTLKELAKRGIYSILVEGGQQLSSAFIAQNMVDRLQLFIAPYVMGNGIRSVAVDHLGPHAHPHKLRSMKWTPSGIDQLLTIDF
jgi:diaminohydroxyphosphoribosylaminopyrimidine deaminase/5-amino-6-(5-phosphoribosylamino)uracil reductase